MPQKHGNGGFARLHAPREGLFAQKVLPPNHGIGGAVDCGVRPFS